MTQLACRLVEDFIRNSLASCVIYFMNQSQEKADAFPSLKTLRFTNSLGNCQNYQSLVESKGCFFSAVKTLLGSKDR